MRSPSGSGHRLALVVVAALLLAPIAAKAEEAVVLGSTAPGQRPGTVIADGESLSLPDGASATLLFHSGQIVKLHGPFAGPLPSAAQNGSDVAGALRMKGVDASAIGGSRDMAPSARRAMDGQEISINPERSATYCIGKADTIWLARPAARARMTIRRHGNARVVAWPPGAQRIEWPGEVIIEDGDRYGLFDAADRRLAEVTFRRVDEKPRTEAAWIAQLVALGCPEQAASGLQELARASVVPELYLASDRGRKPVYHPGETIRLVAQSDLDGQLYCFARSAMRGTVPIFPADAAGGARVEGHVPLSIPGERIHTALRAEGPSSVDEIRCYLADRDIAAALPAAVLDRNFTPLPQEIAEDLDTVFATVPLTRIAKAALEIKVE